MCGACSVASCGTGFGSLAAGGAQGSARVHLFLLCLKGKGRTEGPLAPTTLARPRLRLATLQALWMSTMAYGGARLLVSWGFDGDCVRWGRRCCWAVWLGGTYICWALGGLRQWVVGWWFGGCCALPDSVRLGSWGVQTCCWVRGHLLEIWAGPRCWDLGQRLSSLGLGSYCLLATWGPLASWKPYWLSLQGGHLAAPGTCQLGFFGGLQYTAPWCPGSLLGCCLGVVRCGHSLHLPGYIQCQTFLPADTCTHKRPVQVHTHTYA